MKEPLHLNFRYCSMRKNKLCIRRSRAAGKPWSCREARNNISYESTWTFGSILAVSASVSETILGQAIVMLDNEAFLVHTMHDLSGRSQM